MPSYVDKYLRLLAEKISIAESASKLIFRGQNCCQFDHQSSANRMLKFS